MLTRRQSLKLLLAVTPVAALTNGFCIEPARLSITRRDIHLANLPAELDGFTIAQLTDFHYKPDDDHALIEKAVIAANAENVDLIALTGDYVDTNKAVIVPLLEHLQKLQSQYGMVATMGNHDGWIGPGKYYKGLFEKIGCSFLINQNTKIDIAGTPLHIAGTDYVWNGNPDPVSTLKGIPTDAPVIALVHEPDYFDTMRSMRAIDLQLSGHTHGGQCRVPLIGYAPRKVSYGRNYLYDLYSKDDSQLFVSRGVGTSAIRVRFACPPELAILTLRRA